MTMFASMPITDPELIAEKRSATSPIHVVAAALRRPDGYYLITRRRPGTHLEGYWEFPGGKVEEGESVAEALIREIEEELGIIPKQFSPLVEITHQYSATKTIFLEIWNVHQWEGDPYPIEGQEMAWVSESELDSYTFPPADQPAIQALRFSPLFLITPPRLSQGVATFLEQLEQALQQGVRMVLLRTFDYGDASPEEVFLACRERCQQVGARLIQHHHTRLGEESANGSSFQPDGIHLTSSEMRAYSHRPDAKTALLGASCHSIEELQQAASIGVDYAFLSPVKPTASHPDATPLGWSEFQRAVQTVDFPVYALGGMRREELSTSRAHGGQGIAGISLFFPPTSEVASR
jgi:8-oxo-dGTP diphosphatase